MNDSKKFSIYLASPYGFTDEGRAYMYGTIVPLIEKLDIIVINPWNLTKSSEFDEICKIADEHARKKALHKLDMDIGERNKKAIDEADGVVAILNGTDVDSGVAGEVGYAAAKGKPMVGYRGDFRLATDNVGTTVNLQVEYFIEMNGGYVTTTLDELTRAIKKVFLKE